MPAPTALIRAPEYLAEDISNIQNPEVNQDDSSALVQAPNNHDPTTQTTQDSTEPMHLDAEDRPVFAPEN